MKEQEPRSLLKRAKFAPCVKLPRMPAKKGLSSYSKSRSFQRPWLNALTGEYVDMIKAGILDPTKVVRCALENAVSIAGLLLTTEAIVADIPEDKNASAAPVGMEY